jgi:thioredoxin-related protein
MDTVTYPDPRVAEFIERHFLPVQVKVKQNKDLVEEYLVVWTPNVIVCDERGRVHYCIDGYLPPEDFLARLSLGIGRYRLNRKQYPQAVERFEEVSRRHAASEAGAAALYWLGVTHYKQSHDPAQLRPMWEKLAREHPGSEWTRRTQIPRKS